MVIGMAIKLHNLLHNLISMVISMDIKLCRINRFGNVYCYKYYTKEVNHCQKKLQRL